MKTQQKVYTSLLLLMALVSSKVASPHIRNDATRGRWLVERFFIPVFCDILDVLHCIRAWVMSRRYSKALRLQTRLLFL